MLETSYDIFQFSVGFDSIIYFYHVYSMAQTGQPQQDLSVDHLQWGLFVLDFLALSHVQTDVTGSNDEHSG